MEEFHVNEYLSVRLEDGKTKLYVMGEPFIQCKFLLLNIPIAKIATFDEIESIDEAAERLYDRREYDIMEVNISPEVEFWGHCSNLQVWYEHDYDTRLIHSNLAFPLLKKLAEAGDPQAKQVFKQEILKRYKDGTDRTKDYLATEGFLQYTTLDERLNILLDNKNFAALMELSEQVVFDQNPLPTIVSLLDCIKIENRKNTELNLSDLDLIEFPEATLNLDSLEILYLSLNKIREIPEEIDKLISLRELNLIDNEISYLPDSICNIISLKKLWLSENKLNYLPKSIGNLKNLEALRLEGNHLQTLPKSFCKLQSLKELHLSKNQIYNLPECIGTMKSLDYLNLKENPISKAPNIKKRLSNIKKVITN